MDECTDRQTDRRMHARQTKCDHKSSPCHYVTGKLKSKHEDQGENPPAKRHADNRNQQHLNLTGRKWRWLIVFCRQLQMGRTTPIQYTTQIQKTEDELDKVLEQAEETRHSGGLYDKSDCSYFLNKIFFSCFFFIFKLLHM